MLADAGHRDRRHRRRRRRRHGVDEQLPVPAAARPRGPAHGQRRGRRLDDPRRPVVRVRAVPHGQRRRGRRRALPRRPRARRTPTPRAATRRPRARPPRAAFTDEILPVSIPQKKGDAARRRPRRSRSAPTRRPRRSRALKPAFKKDGTVTAGNAPGVNDGASALVVMAADARDVARPHAARAHRRPGDQRPRAEARADDAGRSRAHASLQKTGWTLDDVDLFELNEAFAVQAVAVLQRARPRSGEGQRATAAPSRSATRSARAARAC